MESGKHKKRINYTVMVVSDSPEGGIRPFCLEKNLVTALLAVIVIALVVSTGAAFYHSDASKKVQVRETELQKKSCRTFSTDFTKQTPRAQTDRREPGSAFRLLKTLCCSISKAFGLTATKQKRAAI